MDLNTGTSSGGGPSRDPGGEFNYADPLRSFLETLRRVLVSPRAFFRGISHRRGFTNPLIFAVICALIGAVLNGVIDVLLQVDSETESLDTETGPLSTAVSSFIWSMAGLVITTGVYQLFVSLLVGANNAGLEGTFRVVSYAWAVQVLNWIPLLGLLVSLYGLYLCAFGFQEVHSTTYPRGAAIAALPLLLLIPLALLFGFCGHFLALRTRPSLYCR